MGATSDTERVEVMGAEFIGGIVRVDRTFEEAKAELEMMTDEEIVSIVEDMGLEVWERVEPKDMVYDMLTMVYDAVNSKRRDGTMFVIEDHDYVVTGGMSWGDMPTDLCEAVWIIAALNITTK